MEASPPTSPKAGSKESDKESPGRTAKKPKKPKAKKLTPAQAAAELDIAASRDFLSSVATKYKADQKAQLEVVAGFFDKSFRESEVPFNKTVLEQPLSKASRSSSSPCVAHSSPSK